VDRKTFERLKSVGVRAHISVAADVFRDQNARQMTAAQGEFLVPDVGRCRLDGQVSYGIRCVSPLIKPATLLVITDLAASTCPQADRQEDESAKGEGENSTPTNGMAYAWAANGTQGPAEYGVSPVALLELYFWNRDERRKTPRICPGTPLRISFPEEVERSRIEFEASGVKLSDYRQKGFTGDGMIGFSIGR
jgi:hypothetical protein